LQGHIGKTWKGTESSKVPRDTLKEKNKLDTEAMCPSHGTLGRWGTASYNLRVCGPKWQATLRWALLHSVGF
jgi:hypothetical protein